MRIVCDEGDEEPAAALMGEDSSCGRLHRRLPTEFDNSFEALAENSDDEDEPSPQVLSDSEVDDHEDDASPSSINISYVLCINESHGREIEAPV